MPDRRVTLALMLLAVLARGALVLVLQSHHVSHSTFEHGEIAANLLAGRGFSVQFLGAEGPTSQQAPLYPVVVAGAYAIGGVETPQSLLILELGQAVLGGLLVLGVIVLAREALPGHPGVAAAAGLLAALHPSLVYAATHVQVASLAATLTAWTLALAYRTGRTGHLRDALATGASLGLLCLTDPILAMTGWGGIAAIALGQGYRRAGKLSVVVLGTAALAVAPWIVRNYSVHGEIVWIKSTFGYAFWQGNCALSEGTDKVVRTSVERTLTKPTSSLRDLNNSLWVARHQAGYLDDIALSKADYQVLGKLSEPARSRWLFQRALGDLRAEPGRYPRLCFRRLRYFLLFDETNPKTRNLVYRTSHLALSLTALLGWILTGRGRRRRLLPTLLTAALIALFHSLTIVSARFHVPIEPLLALWAAAGLARFGSSTVATGNVLEGVGLEERRLGVGIFRPLRLSAANQVQHRQNRGAHNG